MKTTATLLRFALIFSLTLTGLVLSQTVSAQTHIQQGDKTLIIGGSGRTGRLVMQALHDQGYDVTGMTRSIERARENVSPDYKWIEGDLGDASSIDKAIKGKSLVVFAATATAGGQEGNTPYDIDYMGVVKSVDAALVSNVRHFVLISSMNVTVKDHPMNKFLDNMLIRKFEGEDYLRASGLAYTIIRPGGLLDNLKGNQGVMYTQGDIVRGGSIRRIDLADDIVRVLGNEQAYNKTFEVFSFPSNQPPGMGGDKGERPIKLTDLRKDVAN